MYIKAYIHHGREDGMTELTATEARQNWFQVLRKSLKGHVPVRIVSKDGGVVMMSQEDYDSLLETLELLSKPGLRQSIKEARADIKAGRTKSLKKIFGR